LATSSGPKATRHFGRYRAAPGALFRHHPRILAEPAIGSAYDLACEIDEHGAVIERDVQPRPFEKTSGAALK
jgi:hypothetical protein